MRSIGCAKYCAHKNVFNRRLKLWSPRDWDTEGAERRGIGIPYPHILEILESIVSSPSGVGVDRQPKLDLVRF